MTFGRQLSRCFHPSRPSPRAGDHAATIVWLWPGSSLSFGPASLGRCCPANWAARNDLPAQVARLAGRWGLGWSPPCALGAPVGCGSTGLEPGCARQRVGGGEKGGAETGPNPTDRGKAGTKRHVVVDRRGTPLEVCLSPAN